MSSKFQNRPHSQAEINKLIDFLVHPFIRDYPWLSLVDGALHALNEQDPRKSFEKFVRYNAKPLIMGLKEELGRIEIIERQTRERLRKQDYTRA